jgi:Zn-dependent peptidase ImmA (M78 family)
MKNYKIIILLMLLASCTLIDEAEYKVQPELEVMVDEFFTEARKRQVHLNKMNLIVYYADIKKDIGGDSGRNGSQRVVRINLKYKDSRVIKHIVFHELGHALLYRSHTDRPSIMQPQVKDPMMTEEYIDELFGFRRIK